MKFDKALAVAALASFTDATCQKYTDNFDDLTGSSLTPQFTNVKTYHGITYEAFTVSTASNITGTIAGIVPQSPPNAAGFTMVTDIIQLGAITVHPFGNLVAALPVKSFDLKSFYFGCALNTHTPTLTTNQDCTILVCGYKTDGALVPCSTYRFHSNDPLKQNMAFAQLPANLFTNLKNVTFAVDLTALDFVTTSQSVLFVDDVVHCNY